MHTNNMEFSDAHIPTYLMANHKLAYYLELYTNFKSF